MLGDNYDSAESSVEDVRGFHVTQNDASQKRKYLLSWFFLRQILVAIRIRPTDADLIVTALREELLRRKIKHLSQATLETIVFELMTARLCYPCNPYQDDFNVLSRFYAARGALVVVVFGVPCIDPCLLIMRLAEGINIPNIVRTQLVANVLSYPNVSPLLPLGHNEATILETFKAKCRTVYEGLTGDFEKAKTGGKSVLVQGFHIDPILYNFDTEAQSIFSNAKLPVVVVPFLLTGSLHPRQIHKICQITSVSQTVCEESLKVIQRYLLTSSQHVNVVALDGTDDINEATLVGSAVSFKEEGIVN